MKVHLEYIIEEEETYGYDSVRITIRFPLSDYLSASSRDKYVMIDKFLDALNELDTINSPED